MKLKLALIHGRNHKRNQAFLTDFQRTCHEKFSSFEGQKKNIKFTEELTRHYHLNGLPIFNARENSQLTDPWEIADENLCMAGIATREVRENLLSLFHQNSAGVLWDSYRFFLTVSMTCSNYAIEDPQLLQLPNQPHSLKVFTHSTKYTAVFSDKLYFGYNGPHTEEFSLGTFCVKVNFPFDETPEFNIENVEIYIDFNINNQNKNLMLAFMTMYHSIFVNNSNGYHLTFDSKSGTRKPSELIYLSYVLREHHLLDYYASLSDKERHEFSEEYATIRNAQKINEYRQKTLGRLALLQEISGPDRYKIILDCLILDDNLRQRLLFLTTPQKRTYLALSTREEKKLFLLAAENTSERIANYERFIALFVELRNELRQLNEKPNNLRPLNASFSLLTYLSSTKKPKQHISAQKKKTKESYLAFKNNILAIIQEIEPNNRVDSGKFSRLNKAKRDFLGIAEIATECNSYKKIIELCSQLMIKNPKSTEDDSLSSSPVSTVHRHSF